MLWLGAKPTTALHRRAQSSDGKKLWQTDVNHRRRGCAMLLQQQQGTILLSKASYRIRQFWTIVIRNIRINWFAALQHSDVHCPSPRAHLRIINKFGRTSAKYCPIIPDSDLERAERRSQRSCDVYRTHEMIFTMKLDDICFHKMFEVF